VEGERKAVELGRAEVMQQGSDGSILCFGSLLSNCLSAAEQLKEHGLDVGVINARFAKPLDWDAIEQALADSKFLVTVEEGQLMGGFGSAVLEAINEAGLDAARVRRLGIPDRFSEHGTREELLAELGLDADGIANACRELCGVNIRQAESETVQ
jgi:1-deoxy-D-xylulose-5-phosphate synthase